MAKKPLSRNENELENLEAQNSSQQRADGGANIQTRHTGVVTPAAEEKEQKDYFANTLSPDLESDDDNENSEAEGAGAGVEGKGATGAVTPATPTSTPSKAPAPSTKPTETPSGDEDNEQVLDEEFEEGDGEGEETDAEGADSTGEGGESGDGTAPKTPTPATPATTEPQAPKPEATQPVTPAQKPVSELTQEEANQLFNNWRSQTEDVLSTHHYRLTEEQVNELNDNPAAFIPKMMSRVYMDSITAAFQQFTTYLPRMVGQVLESRNNIQKAESSFFDRWPDLAQHRDLVIRLGTAYRNANPKATAADFINEVGAQAMVALRKNPSDTSGASEKRGPGRPKKDGTSPALGNGANNGNALPFRPAISTPAPMPNVDPTRNIFDQLASDFGEETEEDTDDFG